MTNQQPVVWLLSQLILSSHLIDYKPIQPEALQVIQLGKRERE